MTEVVTSNIRRRETNALADCDARIRAAEVALKDAKDSEARFRQNLRAAPGPQNAENYTTALGRSAMFEGELAQLRDERLALEAATHGDDRNAALSTIAKLATELDRKVTDGKAAVDELGARLGDLMIEISRTTRSGADARTNLAADIVRRAADVDLADSELDTRKLGLPRNTNATDDCAAILRLAIKRLEAQVSRKDAYAVLHVLGK